MTLDLYTITSAETGHMTERFTPSKNQWQNTISKDKNLSVWDATTNETLHMNCVFSLVYATSHCWNEPEKG